VCVCTCVYKYTYTLFEPGTFVLLLSPYIMAYTYYFLIFYGAFIKSGPVKFRTALIFKGNLIHVWPRTQTHSRPRPSVPFVQTNEKMFKKKTTTWQTNNTKHVLSCIIIIIIMHSYYARLKKLTFTLQCAYKTVTRNIYCYFFLPLLYSFSGCAYLLKYEGMRCIMIANNIIFPMNSTRMGEVRENTKYNCCTSYVIRRTQ